MGAGMGSRKTTILMSGLVGILLCGFVAYKVVQAPEWTVLTGDAEARQRICMSVYQKSAPRARWCLKHLLHDETPEVRLSAITALQLRPDLHEAFTDRIRELAEAENLHVRGRALEFILENRVFDTREWLPRIRKQLSGASFRRRNPSLLSLYLSHQAQRGKDGLIPWVLRQLEKNAESAGTYGVLLNHRELLRPHRQTFITMLGEEEGPARDFALEALTVIDGQMRGTRPSDWSRDLVPLSDDASESLQPRETFFLEAEWAHRVTPNFQIDTVKGRKCLSLGEGAGGKSFWRDTNHYTVDIGTFDIRFNLARSGHYDVWFLSWFSDKCGNNSIFELDGRLLTSNRHRMGHRDRTDPLKKWHWSRILVNEKMSKGTHTLTVTAADDGLYYDKVVIIPVGKDFEGENPPPATPLYSEEIPTRMSITAESQSQVPGTDQKLTVWVRRNSRRIAGGTVELDLQPPFNVRGTARQHVTFEDDDPLVSVPFTVQLAAGARSGETEVDARFSINGEQYATDDIILGTRYDWLTTGPLPPDSTECRSLLKSGTKNRVDTEWKPFPENGYDRYRRLDFEDAYGEQSHKYIFLYTEIDVDKTGNYKSYLTLDDRGWIWIDGRKVAGRDKNRVGEGHLMIDKIHLTKGRHQVFVRLYQQKGIDPTGEKAGRVSPNHWVFKWLLRRSKHQPSPHIHRVPLRDQ